MFANFRVVSFSYSGSLPFPDLELLGPELANDFSEVTKSYDFVTWVTIRRKSFPIANITGSVVFFLRIINIKVTKKCQLTMKITNYFIFFCDIIADWQPPCCLMLFWSGFANFSDGWTMNQKSSYRSREHFGCKAFSIIWPTWLMRLRENQKPPFTCNCILRYCICSRQGDWHQRAINKYKIENINKILMPSRDKNKIENNYK